MSDERARRDATRAALGALFTPARIALIGDNHTTGGILGRIGAALTRHGFLGEVLEVAPGESLPEGAAPDLAALVGDPQQIRSAARQCARRGVSAAIIFSDVTWEGDLLDADSAKHGLRLLGPSSAGAATIGHALVSPLSATSDAIPLLQGPVALFGQSAASVTAVLSHGAEAGVGFRYFASTGHEMDLGLPELITHAAEDEDCRVIALVLEELPRVGAFAQAVQLAAQNRTRVVALPIGKRRTPSAGLARGRLLDALLRRLAVPIASSATALVEIACALAVHDRTLAGRVAVLAGESSAALHLADQFPAATSGSRTRLADLAHSPPESLRRLSAGTPQNPLSLGRMDNSMERIEIVARALERDLDLDLIVGTFETEHFQGSAHALLRGAGDKPVMLFDAARAVPAAGRHVLAQAGAPVLSSASTVVEAARALGTPMAGPFPGARVVHVPELPSGLLDEADAKTWLWAANLPIAVERVVTTRERARREADRIGYPVLFRAVSPDVRDREAIGAVRLHVADGDSAERAFDAVEKAVHDYAPDARFTGAIVQRPSTGLELMVGARVIERVGTVVRLGLGGPLLGAGGQHGPLEFFGPLLPRDARRMVLSFAERLSTAAAAAVVAKSAPLVDLLVRLSLASTAACPRLRGITLHPVVLSPTGTVTVVDARIDVAND